MALQSVRTCCVFAVIALTAVSAAPMAAEEPAAPAQVEVTGARIGFDGAYKLGCWTPLALEVLGSTDQTVKLQVSVPDTDGVPTRVEKSIALKQKETATARLFVRIGQTSSPVSVRLLSEDRKRIAERTFFLGARDVRGTPSGYPATNRLVLEFGGTLGLEELLQSSDDGEQLTTHLAQVDSADDLPQQWYGYESVETVVLTTSNPKLYSPLQQNSDRVDALDNWVRRGGQLIIFCASSAEQLLADDGVLARFAPGKFEKMERLNQPQPLATFSGSERIARIRRIDLAVPSLVDVEGRILSSAGRSATNVPLVVRTRHGLGEVVFVGLDFDQPPLSNWEGRPSFLRRVLEWRETDTDQPTSDQLEPTDLISHLRNSLDKKFVGVQVISFGLVAFLAGAYLLLIGPGDYLFVRRVLNRPALTWLTFPLIVVAVSALAYVLGSRMKGDQLRVNQVEVIDVDCTTSNRTADEKPSKLVRGTVWTHFFTPKVSTLDLELQPHIFGKPISQPTDTLSSWLGLPGFALGGMQASGSQTTVLDEGYSYGDDLAKLQALPVQTWSTKTLASRWSATVDPQIKIKLAKDGEELVRGTIENQSSVQLTDCSLFYGRWAYRLGQLPAGKSVEVSDSLQPRTVKTLLTNATAGDERVMRTSEDGTVAFTTAKWDIARLLKVMMFYEALDGENYSKMVNRYQPFLDLSNILDHDDKAILLARCEAPGTQWKTATDDLASDQDRRWTYYRFVVSVEDRENDD